MVFVTSNLLVPVVSQKPYFEVYYLAITIKQAKIDNLVFNE